MNQTLLIQQPLLDLVDAEQGVEQLRELSMDEVQAVAGGPVVENDGV